MDVKKYIKRVIILATHRGKKIKISQSANINIKTVFEGKNSVADDCTICDSFIGYASYISSNTRIQFTLIGRYCSLGHNIICGVGEHPSRQWVSTHPAFFSTAKQAGFSYVNDQLFDELPKMQSGYSVEIGNDVWIGDNALIFNKVKIGDGAIIGADAIVTHDVPSYAIVVGNPAKIIRYRFEPEQIEWLQKLRWWFKDDAWLREHAESFRSFDMLKNRMEAEECI